jgi:transcriptional regulator with XRE-family HTH domain
MSAVGLSKIERGMSNPRTLTRRALCDALDYDEEDLFPPPGQRSPDRELRVWAKRVYKKRKRR